MDVVLSTEAGYAIWFNRADGRYSREVRTPGARHDGRGPALLPERRPRRRHERRPPRRRRARHADAAARRRRDGPRPSSRRPSRCPIPGATLTDGADGQISRARLEDVDGDGLADLVVERAEVGELHCWLNRGTDALAPRIVGDRHARALRPGHRRPLGRPQRQRLDGPRLRRLGGGRAAARGGHRPAARRHGAPEPAHAHRQRARGRPPRSSGAPARCSSSRPGARPPLGDDDPLPGAGGRTRSTRPRAWTSTSAPGVDRMRKEFAYRDGFYEDRERAFRGFAEVRVTEPGDASAPTRVDVSGFFTGRSGRRRQRRGRPGRRDPRRGPTARRRRSRGLLRFAETRSAAGVVYLREENDWRVRTLLAGTDGSEVRLAVPRAQRHPPLRGDGGAGDGAHRPGPTTTSATRPTERRLGALSINGDEAVTATEYINDTARWLSGCRAAAA